jgi:cell wall-associated NlpC family hydrolase
MLRPCPSPDCEYRRSNLGFLSTTRSGLLRLSPFVTLIIFGLVGCAVSPTERRSGSRIVIAESRAEQTQKGLSDLAIHAIGLVGVPYKWGGNTPAGGFDCSGLVVYVAYRAKGLKLPRTVAEMSRYGRDVDTDQRLPGDLVFFNTTGHPFSHVGIYVGKNRFVHAPNEGGTVRIESLLSSYWAPRLTSIRRLATP